MRKRDSHLMRRLRETLSEQPGQAHTVRSLNRRLGREDTVEKRGAVSKYLNQLTKDGLLIAQRMPGLPASFGMVYTVVKGSDLMLPERSTLRSRILEVMHKYPAREFTAQRLNELLDRTHTQKANTVTGHALRQMVDEGMLVKERRQTQTTGRPTYFYSLKLKPNAGPPARIREQVMRFLAQHVGQWYTVRGINNALRENVTRGYGQSVTRILWDMMDIGLIECRPMRGPGKVKEFRLTRPLELDNVQSPQEQVLSLLKDTPGMWYTVPEVRDNLLGYEGSQLAVQGILDGLARDALLEKRQLKEKSGRGPVQYRCPEPAEVAQVV